MRCEGVGWAHLEFDDGEGLEFGFREGGSHGGQRGCSYLDNTRSARVPVWAVARDDANKVERRSTVQRSPSHHPTAGRERGCKCYMTMSHALLAPQRTTWCVWRRMYTAAHRQLYAL